jgi:hypothetical protein
VVAGLTLWPREPPAVTVCSPRGLGLPSPCSIDRPRFLRCSGWPGFIPTRGLFVPLPGKRGPRPAPGARPARPSVAPGVRPFGSALTRPRPRCKCAARVTLGQREAACAVQSCRGRVSSRHALRWRLGGSLAEGWAHALGQRRHRQVLLAIDAVLNCVAPCTFVHHTQSLSLTSPRAHPRNPYVVVIGP